jgi:hypothetical protein
MILGEMAGGELTKAHKRWRNHGERINVWRNTHPCGAFYSGNQLAKSRHPHRHMSIPSYNQSDPELIIRMAYF